jgi:hypothetical protein
MTEREIGCVFRSGKPSPHPDWSEQAFTRRRDYQRVYHEMPSRQTVWNIVNKFRQHGYTIILCGDIYGNWFTSRDHSPIELRQIIENVCDEIRGDPDFLNKLTAASQAFRSRIQWCIDIGGRQLESGRFEQPRRKTGK